MKYIFSVLLFLIATATTGCNPFGAQSTSDSLFLAGAGSGGSCSQPVGTNVIGANGQLITTIPIGQYDGTKTVTASDTNLTAPNIAFGVAIFGVTGSANLEAHIDCTASNQA